MLIDSHCHLESALRQGIFDEILGNAAAADVNRMITIGTGPDDWNLYRQLAAENPGTIAHTVGIHPCSVDADWEQAVAVLEDASRQTPQPVAIGEIGLDDFHLPKDTALRDAIRARQRLAYAAQLELAARLNWPVVIHSRSALDDSIALLRASPVAPETAVFHCFNEGPDEMKKVIAIGSRASFTGIATYPSAANVRAALKLQGIEKLMLETDSPYLSPQPMRGKPNQPAFVRLIATAIAGELGMSFDDLAEITSRNTTTFFKL